MRVTTLTCDRGDGIKWGFDEMGNLIQDSAVNPRHLDQLSYALNLKDGYVNSYNIDLDQFHNPEDFKNAPKFHYKIHPNLKIYLNYNMSLEHFQNSNLKAANQKGYSVLTEKVQGSEILYLKEVGDINPPDCNFYFNPGQTMLRNLEQL